ncbi:MAG TPA: hypothetical protein VIT92_08205 [Burkholderiaceae bacterium]
MKHLTLLLCATLVLAGCGKQPAAEDGAAPAPAATSASAAAVSARAAPAQDGAAIATIETADYVIQVHKAITFMPDAGKTGGVFAPKEGNHFVALDISVRNKTQAPLEMGTVMLQSQVVDAAGNAYSGTLPVLTAYTLSNPDATQSAQYDAIWSMEYPAGAYHRTVALGFEAPKSLKTFTLKFPVKPNANEKAEAKLSL